MALAVECACEVVGRRTTSVRCPSEAEVESERVFVERPCLHNRIFAQYYPPSPLNMTQLFSKRNTHPIMARSLIVHPRYVFCPHDASLRRLLRAGCSPFSTARCSALTSSNAARVLDL